MLLQHVDWSTANAATSTVDCEGKCRHLVNVLQCCKS